MRKVFTLLFVVPVWATCLFPSISLARNEGPGTLIETRPFETDEHITATIRGMIGKNKRLKGQHINVSTNHAVVTLTGSVDGQQKANEAEAMIRRMPEVDKVRNRLKVQRQ